MEIKFVTFYQLELEIELNIKNEFLSNLKKPILKNNFFNLGAYKRCICVMYLLTMNIHVLFNNRKNNILCSFEYQKKNHLDVT